MLTQFIQTFKSNNFPQNSLKSVLKTGLTRKTLLNMGLRITCVVLLSALASYFHIILNLETQTTAQLEKYIIERQQRESNLFQLAEDNLTSLKERFLWEIRQPISSNEKQESPLRFFHWNDGTLRSFPQNQPIENFDSIRHPATFIGRNIELDANLQRRLTIADKLLKGYGSAWSHRFPNTYFLAPENSIVMYWKGIPWSLDAKPDIYFPNEEFFYIADLQHDLEKKASMDKFVS